MRYSLWLVLLLLLSACSLIPKKTDPPATPIANIPTQTTLIVTATLPPAAATPTRTPTDEPAPTALPTRASATRVPTQTNCTPRADWTGTYVVAGGDTLGSIARNFGTTASALAQANCLPNTNIIYVGQALRVPSGQLTISAFTSSATSANYGRVSRREERIPVVWTVLNRPDTANLAFEQILENGTAQNIELPRPNPWVNSSGEGLVSPMLPGGANNLLRLRLRVFDMASNATLAIREITIPIEPPTPTVDSSQAVVRFDVQPRTVKNGDPITISWEIRNVPSTSVYWLHNGMSSRHTNWVAVQNQNPYPATGTVTITAPEYATSASFTLGMIGSNIPDTSRTITITINCRDPWWVNPAKHPNCPARPMQSVAGTYQAFENGFIILSAADNRFYVFIASGSRALANSWNGQPITWTETPPEGRLLPQNGFGWLWVNDPDLRTQLGWATSAEQQYTLQYQHTPPGPVDAGEPQQYYMTLPDARVVPFILSMGGSISSWQPPITP